MTDTPILGIELQGRTVTLSCSDNEAAIELYYHLLAEARRAGVVNLVVEGLRARNGAER